jgi:hypothetical protein
MVSSWLEVGLDKHLPVKISRETKTFWIDIDLKTIVRVRHNLSCLVANSND